MSDLVKTMLRLWESACRDEPRRPSCQVLDGKFTLRINGNRLQWTEMCAAAGVPSHAHQVVDDDTLTVTWPSLADEIFGADGKLAQLVPHYELRLPQLHMARLCQRAIEMRQPAVVEAGVGTGKSFAYAAICLAMKKKVIISTSNKNLQMQLYRKDVPLLLELFPGRQVALAVGKGNYACRAKAQDLVSGEVTIREPALAEWFKWTLTGNTEEITFATDWKALDAITVDDECSGKHCPHYADCFYYAAKAERQNADVIITNHALLCLHQLYPQAGILPTAEVIVVDEAHKLPDYARNALGFETTPRRILSAIRKAQKYVNPQELVYSIAEDFVDEFTRYLLPLTANNKEFQIGLGKEQSLVGGDMLRQALLALADAVWDTEKTPKDGDEKKQAKRATALRTLADNLQLLHTAHEGVVRWLEPDRDDRSAAEKIKLCAAPHDVSAFIGSLAGFAQNPSQNPSQGADYTTCSRCGRTLTAPTVHILDDQPYGPDCIRQVDALGDAEQVPLAEWLRQEHPAQSAPAQAAQKLDAPIRLPAVGVIFCSATLAAPDLSHFLRTCGIPDALQMQAESPFDYGRQALLYAPNGAAPQPNSAEYLNWLLGQLEQMIHVVSGAGSGGTFFLFTSYGMMNAAVRYLEPILRRKGLTMLVQGELPKLETARRFREDGNAVLFATKSFFEGISIDGDALRLVVVDKLPFEAPSPLSRAMDQQATEYARDVLGLAGSRLERYPFEALAVPKMIIELKQATGRLIRTRSDTGVMAVLDSRLRATQYGRNQVLPSLPKAELASELEEVRRFFAARTPQPTPQQAVVEARPQGAQPPLPQALPEDCPF